MWTPTPTQATFLRLIAEAPPQSMPAYIGAFGCGKSAVLCRAAIGLSLTYPGIVGLIGREEFTDLRDSTQDEFFQQLIRLEDAIRQQLPEAQRAGWTGLGRHRRDVNDYEWSNGSVTRFRPLAEAARKYKSMTLGYVGIDEASEVDHEASADPPSLLMLLGRLRQVGMPCIGFTVSNPTGFDHWLYKWYGKDARPTGDRVWTGAKGFPVVRTNSAENPHLPAGYIDNLRARYPADHVRRYLEGEWGGIDEGAPIFPTFDPSIHVRPLAWVRRWPVKVGIDLGTQAPGVVWAQVDPVEERLHVLRTWAPRNLDVYKLAEGIKIRNDQWFPLGHFDYFAGHDANAKKDTNAKSSAEVLAEYGMAPHVRFTATERGFTSMRSLLEIRDDGRPGLFVDPACPTLIEGFSGGYKYRKQDHDHQRKDDEPEKTGVYDPLMDATRYIVVHTFSTGGRVPVVRAVPAFRGLAPRDLASSLDPVRPRYARSR